MDNAPEVASEDETLALLKQGRSIARFGDGELKIAVGMAIKSQVSDPRLARRLRTILQKPGDCLVGVPGKLKNAPADKAKYFANVHSRQFLKLYNENVRYVSPWITRADTAPWIDRPEFWSGIESLWRGKDVVVARGSTKSLTADFLNARGAKSVREVMTPRQNAFAEYDRILREIGRPAVAILCCGPTATVLAVDLCAAGVQALDLGHIGMFMRGYPLDVAKMKLADDPKKQPLDNPKIQGWFKFADVYLDEVKRAPKAGAHFVEVGAWKGRSAFFMANAIKSSGKSIAFDVVDHWEGSANHFDNPSVVKGTLYDEFLANVAPVRQYLNPLRMSSTDAAKRFKKKSLDFVMIDASHDYKNVKADLAAWLPKLKKGGTIAGDDWNWSGVHNAVTEVFGGFVEVLGEDKGRHWRVRDL